MQNNKKAFTIVELLVVIVIIGILAAIIIPQITSALSKAKLTADITLVASINNIISAELLTHKGNLSATYLKKILSKNGINEIVTQTENTYIFFDCTTNKAELYIVENENIYLYGQNSVNKTLKPVYATQAKSNVFTITQPEEIFPGKFILTTGNDALSIAVNSFRTDGEILTQTPFDFCTKRLEQLAQNAVKFNGNEFLCTNLPEKSVIILTEAFQENISVDENELKKLLSVKNIHIPDGITYKNSDFVESILENAENLEHIDFCDEQIAKVIRDVGSAVESSLKGKYLGYRLKINANNNYTASIENYFFEETFVPLSRIIIPNEGFEIVSLCDTDGKEIPIVKNFDKNGIIMPAYDLEIFPTVLGKSHTVSFNIKTYDEKSCDCGYIIDENGEKITSTTLTFRTGESNLFTFNAIANQGYEFLHWEYKGEKVNLESFIMPDEDIILTAVFGYKNYNVTIKTALFSLKTNSYDENFNENIATFIINGNNYAEDFKAKYTEELLLRHILNNGVDNFRLLRWEFLDNENCTCGERCSAVIKNDNFIMPAHDITVIAVFEPLYEMQVSCDENSTIAVKTKIKNGIFNENISDYTVESGKKVVLHVGYTDEITLTATISKGFKLSHWEINGLNNKNLIENPFIFTMAKIELDNVAFTIIAQTTAEFQLPENGYVLVLDGERVAVADTQSQTFENVEITKKHSTFYVEKYVDGSLNVFYGDGIEKYTDISKLKAGLLFGGHTYSIKVRSACNKNLCFFQWFEIRAKIDNKMKSKINLNNIGVYIMQISPNWTSNDELKLLVNGENIAVTQIDGTDFYYADTAGKKISKFTLSKGTKSEVTDSGYDKNRGFFIHPGLTDTFDFDRK